MKPVQFSDPPSPQTGLQSSPPGGPSSQFRLLRYFSLTSLLGVLAVLAVLVYFYRFFAFEALEQHETQANVAITRIFASTIWPRYSEYVKNSGSMANEALQTDPHVAQIKDDLARQMSGLSVVKVKIYDLKGRTVFSTEVSQIGLDSSDDDGFRSALAGNPASEIAFENEVDSFEKVVNDRNMISTYIPIRMRDGDAPEGVFEVYSDVTDYVRELEHTTLQIVALVLGSLGLLYGFLFVIVRRADQTIRLQADEVEVAHRAVLVHQALHDPLTGLPNRASLTQRLEAMLQSGTHGGQGGQRCAVLMLGLDGFKEINDSLGHVVGDLTIREVGKRLSEAFRDAEITARMGGDEFVLVVSEGHRALEVERIVELVERGLRVVSAQPVEAQGQSLNVTVSMGVAIYPEDGDSVLELLRSADNALSHAQKMGRSSYQFHTPDMNTRALEVLMLEGELRQAIAERQFVLHYQPQIDLLSQRVIGAEALIRWQHPQRGLLSPAHFIGLAEERGLIVAIGEWVLDEACRQNSAWQKAGMAPIPIAVNLSARHFSQKNLCSEVQACLEKHQLAPACLELELTETSVVQDATGTIATMRQLKGLGVMLALDDFGTGYSSLSQLKGLPLDSLKLDQSFVRGLPDDRDDLAICTAVIAMGKALGLNVIAEGVEEAGQRDVLRGLGCDQGQGYLFARPLPPEQFFAYVTG